MMDKNEKTCSSGMGSQEPIPEGVAGDKTAQEKDKSNMDKKDLATSVVLMLFGIYVFVTGIRMSRTTMALADSPWYGTPGIFPIVIGGVLILLSAIMGGSLLKAGVRLDRTFLDAAISYLKDRAFIRLVAAIGFFAIYIFVLIGHINFLVSTFLYLFITMVFFREKGFAVWKLALISVAFTGLLYLIFGVLANIPFP